MDQRSRGRLRRVAFGLSLATALSGPGLLQRGEAATGDVLASFDANATAGVPYCSVNTGLAFDGDRLILSCWYSTVLYLVDASTQTSAGSVSIAGLPGGSGLGALAYDAGRDRVWACSAYDYTTVVLIDLATGAVDPSVPSIRTMGCIDGLAYDGSDDTLWTSHDAASTIQHYGLDGTLISSSEVLSKIGYCGNSGIAVGGPDLFLGNNGCSAVYRAAKDLSTSSHFASLGARVEDMECDDRTFDGAGAMWVQDAYDRILTAFEIEPGLCRFGGGAAAAAAESYAARIRVDAAAIDTGTAGFATAGVGESADNSVLAHSVPDVVDVAAGTTHAEANEPSEPVTVSNASAKLTDVSLLGGLVTADAVVAHAGATFDRETDTGEVSSDGSRIAGLTIDGERYDGPIEPNTTITIPDVATIVLREELPVIGDGASIRVNMIHVTSADGAAEAIVSSAFAAAGPGAAGAGPEDPQQPPIPEPDPSTLPVPVPPLPTLPGTGPSFTNGFEAGEAEWTTSGSWQIGAPGAGDLPAKDGERIAGTILGGNYPNGDRAALTSPVIDLTGYDPTDPSPANPHRGTQAHLTFHQTFTSEGWYDCGVVQRSIDDGATWLPIDPLEGYNYTSSAYCGGISAARSFSGGGVDTEWTKYTLDLTPFAGGPVRIRFLFGTDGSVVDKGWSIDDLDLTIVEP